jgi:hypothetical protein
VAREGRRLKVAGLLALGLPDDGVALGALAPPEESALAAASSQELRAAAEHFGELWRRLALEDLGGEWFWSALRAVGSYFGYSLYRLAATAGSTPPLEVLRLVRRENEAEVAAASPETEIQQSEAGALLGAFVACASDLLLAAKVDEMGLQPGDSPIYDADLTALEALETLHSESRDLDVEPLELADTLLTQAMEFRQETVHQRSQQRGKLLQKPPTLVGVRELVALSERHPLMVKEYGVKNVENVFELRLAAIFKTLGFVSVPAPPGRAAVDLLCVAPKDQFSFFVEAKTSRGPYRLPKDDWRAIRDYANDFPAKMPTLRPLEFVLIVGSGPSRTLPERIEALRAEIGVPVKFVSADLIAMLQQEVAGPVDAPAFRDAVVRSAPVLTEEAVVEIKNESQKIATAIYQFVETLM